MSAPALPPRKSVRVDPDLADLATQMRDPGTPAREALEEVVGPLPGRLSEAEVLNQLLRAAALRVRDRLEEDAYAAAHAARTREDDDFKKAVRARRAAREQRLHMEESAQ